MGAQHMFKVHTDHKNLEYFRSLQALNGWQRQWKSRLLEYNFKIVYVPGRSNTKADILSCLPQYECELEGRVIDDKTMLNDKTFIKKFKITNFIIAVKSKELGNCRLPDSLAYQ